MQQPFERYAVVALLFLVALVAVAIFWEDGEPDSVLDAELAAAGLASQPVTERTERPEPTDRGAQRGAGASRSDLQLSSDADLAGGEDLRGRTPSYVAPAQPPSEAGPRAPVSGDEGLSRPSPRGGALQVDPALRSNAVANELANPSTPDGVDARLARDLEREARAREAAATPARGSTTGREHVVREGESLWRIAEVECGDGNRWREIATLNGIGDADSIRAGTKLRLPGAAAPEATASASAPERAPSAPPRQGARAYVVQKGDSLSVIASRELGTVKRMAEIRALNSLRDDRVLAGSTLWLPADAKGTAPAASERGREALASATVPERARATRGEFYVR